jgi:hypothetical protein
MRKAIILITFLLTVTLSYCQNTYPQKIVLNKDTVVAITETQLQHINECFYQRDGMRSDADSMAYLLSMQSLSISRQSNINKKLVLKNTKLLADYLDAIKLYELEKQITYYKEQELKAAKKKQIKMMVGGFSVGIGTAAIVYTIVSINKK